MKTIVLYQYTIVNPPQPVAFWHITCWHKPFAQIEGMNNNIPLQLKQKSNYKPRLEAHEDIEDAEQMHQHCLL